jgi:hypothetical protein
VAEASTYLPITPAYRKLAEGPHQAYPSDFPVELPPTLSIIEHTGAISITATWGDDHDEKSTL